MKIELERTVHRLLLWIGLWLLGIHGGSAKDIRVVPATNTAPAGFVEITGVEADAFNPQFWRRAKLNLVPDARAPFLAPQNGKFRNIYAPSAVETPNGYRLFYGAWDGISSGNDHIYSASTDRDFQNISNRHAIINPGTFVHVCNVNALGFPDGSFALCATVYPVAEQNRPAFIRSDVSGTNWNGSVGEPYTVQPHDIVEIAAYAYAGSDINGMNVLLRENGKYHLYFGDFHHQPGVFSAVSDDGNHYRFEAAVYDARGFVNDLKKFHVADQDFYLLGLHENGASLWQSVSTNRLSFPPAQLLLTNGAAADRYIVALGWVTRGEEASPQRKLLGVLYGAGPVPSLDHNQIYARWLQKRVVLVSDDGKQFAGSLALGPDRQLLQISSGTVLTGKLELFADDGETLLGTTGPLSLHAGQSLKLVQP